MARPLRPAAWAALLVLALLEPGRTEDASGWANEQDLISGLQGPTLVPGEDDLSLLRHCVSRSWWPAARELVARAHRREAAGAAAGIVPVREEVTKLLGAVKQQADGFAAYAETAYRGQTKGLDEVHCALQWAQNSTTVFLGVKYATRWAAPGAIEVVDVDVNISSCCFGLNSFGHHSSIRKRYMVDLDLYGEVAASQSSWSSSSVGRLTAILAKAQPGTKWPRLTKAKGRSRHQVSTWLDMEELWVDEMEKNVDKKARSPHKEKESKGKTKAAEKGKQVYAPWQKTALKYWKKLRKLVENPKKLAGFVGPPAFFIFVLWAIWDFLPARDPGAKAPTGHSLGAAAPGGDREAGAADQGALGGAAPGAET